MIIKAVDVNKEGMCRPVPLASASSPHCFFILRGWILADSLSSRLHVSVEITSDRTEMQNEKEIDGNKSTFHGAGPSETPHPRN